ncbi:MAG: carbohydrate binding family 9 domain-containing protein [Acidobacteria bacterium]|nr:carbohydrate binding family 9 domain-containing protein [Acidobacteriota bacterium]
MRLPRILISILLFSFAVQAQAEQNVKNTTEAGVSDSRGDSRGSKVEVPAEKRGSIKIPFIETGPSIDGKPDEEIWKQAAVFKDFYQTNPGYNTAPSKPTEVYMVYDEKNLYIAFKCWDEPDKIRATVAKRDSVFGEDNVRVWLDTYDDQRRAYLLGFNPLGIQQDGVFTEGSRQGADFSIDIVMESKGVIEDWGWSVEVKIPFKSLRYSAGKGKHWGFNVARNIERLNDELDQWLPDDRDVAGALVKHGRITGLDEIRSERTLEIVPSVTLSETGRRNRTIPRSTVNANRYHPIFNPGGIRDPGRFVNEPVKQDIGVTLKYTITPNVTLDAAVNPDFAEIEADAPVVTANQRFPIFFQEKRPFFLEGQEIFSSPLQPFYSRTIVDPDIAAKLTGKIGKTSFGFLAASDNAPGNYSEDERTELAICQLQRATNPGRNCGSIEEFVDKNAFFSVLRVKRDFGTNNNLGFFGSARVFPKNRNFVGGIDGTFKLDDRTVMTFQALGTHSRKFFFDADLGTSKYRSGNGFGYNWSLDYTTDTRGWYVEASGQSADYRTDAGFTRRTNTNSIFLMNRLSTKSNPKAKLIRVNWNQSARLGYDWMGRSQSGSVGTSLSFSLQGNMSVNTSSGFTYERIFEEEFGAKRTLTRAGAFFGHSERSAYQPYFNFSVNRSFNKRFSASASMFSIWNSFDYDFGAGGQFGRVSPAYLSWLSAYLLDPGSAGSSPGLDPGKGLQFNFGFGFEYKPSDPLRVSLSYSKSGLKRNDSGKAAYETDIVSIRSTYQFSRFAYTRLRLDYDSLTRNVSGQMLFGWNPNPGTAFYVGYNENANFNGFSPYSGQLEPRFERNYRTFFVRASYLFRRSY